MKSISIAVMCIGLSACGGSTSAIQEAVKERLTDPGSAQFGQIVYSRDGNSACAAVNSRNRMGGYAGEQYARVARGADGRWSVTAIPDADCVSNLRSDADLSDIDEALARMNRSLEEDNAILGSAR